MSKIDVLSAWSAGVLRGGAGRFVLPSLGPRPAQRLELYEFEGCPFCRKVREMLTALDLEAVIYPCPKDGTRFRPRAVELGGKAHARLAVRAGTRHPVHPGTQSDPAIAGHIERIADGHIEGWAFDPNRPDQPVELDLLLDGTPIVRLIANRYRADLDRAGLGGGRCAFTAPLPANTNPARLQLHCSSGLPLRRAS